MLEWIASTEQHNNIMVSQGRMRKLDMRKRSDDYEITYLLNARRETGTKSSEPLSSSEKQLKIGCPLMATPFRYTPGVNTALLQDVGCHSVWWRVTLYFASCFNHYNFITQCTM